MVADLYLRFTNCIVIEAYLFGLFNVFIFYYTEICTLLSIFINIFK